jgi:hypothetical protein
MSTSQPTYLLNHRKKLAQTIDHYCRIIFPAVFLSASIIIFMAGRA